MTTIKPVDLKIPGKLVMTSAEYHAHPAIGSTGLKHVLRSPAHYWYEKNNPSPSTPSQIFGTVMHEAILEPNLFATNFLVMPEFTGLTKDGKVSSQSGEARAKKEAWMLENHGKHLLSAAEFDQIKGMLHSVSQHDSARKLLTGGAAEESYFDQCPETGLVRKVRPDFLRDGHIIVDVKTTEDSSPEGFPRTVAKYNYHLSAAYYLDVVSSVIGQRFDKFIILAVEKKPPYAVACHLLDEGTIDAGRFLYKKALKNLKICKDAGQYPGYSKNIEPLAIPNWAFPFEE